MQGQPLLRRIVPAVGAAHVGAEIREAFFDGAEDDARDEAAGADFHVFPNVRLRSDVILREWGRKHELTRAATQTTRTSACRMKTPFAVNACGRWRPRTGR